jgi:predicted nucleic acid-binding protein
MIYADTSFLVSAYGQDANSSAAHKYLEQSMPRLPFTFLHWPETAKALWTNKPDEAERIWDEIQRDIADGQKLYQPDLDADAVARRAAGLVKHFCPRWKKLRSLDVLHVSAAVTGHFRTFASFDTGSFQRVLAHSQKLTVWPPLTAEERKHLAGN